MDYVYAPMYVTPTSESCLATSANRIESLRSLSDTRMKCMDIMFSSLLFGLAPSLVELQVSLYMYVNVLR